MAIYRDQRREDVRVVLDEFEAWLLRERSTQARTAAAYTARVAGFVEWLPAPLDPSLRALTAATVIEWVNLEVARGLKASTLGKQMVMLRSFLQFCHCSARAGHDFAGVVPHAAAWRLSSIPDPVPAGTIETLFASLDPRSSKGLRDRAILLLLTGLGLRACEIAALRLVDVGWQTGSLRIRGKGDRVDELPLPDEVGQALEDYVLYGRGGRVRGDEVFWTVIHPVQPLTANGVCGVVRQVCVSAGVTKFGPHRLRQTFATGVCTPGSTPRASRSGSATRTSRPHRSISTPIWTSNAEPSTACPQSMTGRQPATKHPMRCSRSSPTGDIVDGYVDRFDTQPPSARRLTQPVNITRKATYHRLCGSPHKRCSW
jgi:site-specific recombinase XerD